MAFREQSGGGEYIRADRKGVPATAPLLKCVFGVQVKWPQGIL